MATDATTLLQLQPCVFCGAEVELTGDAYEWEFTCFNANCPFSVLVVRERREEAVAAWNGLKR